MSHYIRLRGLPWSTNEEDIVKFLSGVNIVNGAKGVHMVTYKSNGRNTGEAYVELESADDVDAAFKHNKETMGHRYIEIFDASEEDARNVLRKPNSNSNVVKLRGLPYSITEEEIEQFFEGLEIKPNTDGIVLVMDRRGRASGEAYVQFQTPEETDKALTRNREKIKHRYIEVFRSTIGEMRRREAARSGPYDRRDRESSRRRNSGRSSSRDFSSGNRYDKEDNRFDNYNSGGGTSNPFSRNGSAGNNFSNNGFAGFGDSDRSGNRGRVYEGHCVHMRGLPYYCFETDVYEFFDPVRPIHVEIIYNSKGLHSGSANALFETHDESQMAMKKHRKQMGSRYIELFYDGKIKVNSGAGNPRRL